RAHAVAAREISRIMRSDEPGTDTTRWRAYGAKLMQEMNVGGETLEKIGAAIMQRSRDGDLFSHVEDGTAEALAELKASGLRLGIVSNADGRVASFVEKAGLADFFEVIIDSGNVGVEKPNPRIFEIACEAMKIKPEETVYVGDIYEIDVLGARAAGIKAFLLHNGEKDPHWDADVEVIPTLYALRSTLYAE